MLCEEELNPSIYNEVTVIDSETGEQIKLSITEALIEEYKNTLRNFNKRLEVLAKKYGGKFISVNSSKSIEEIVLNDFNKKKVIY